MWAIGRWEEPKSPETPNEFSLTNVTIFGTYKNVELLDSRNHHCCFRDQRFLPLIASTDEQAFPRSGTFRNGLGDSTKHRPGRFHDSSLFILEEISSLQDLSRIGRKRDIVHIGGFALHDETLSQDSRHRGIERVFD